MDAAARLLRVLSLLQTRPTWTAQELGERLGITTRTVRRDVTRLRELGYPVDADPGPLGGYRLGSGGVLPPLLLDDDEAVAVAVGLRAAAGTGVAGLEDAAVAVLVKLEQVLPAVLRERVAALHSVTVRLVGPRPETVDADLLITVAQGCRRLERLHFDYVDSVDRASQRRVEPFRLVATERRWYLVAYDLDRKDWRTFRLDRMAAARLTGARFVRGEVPDAAKLVAEGMSLAPYPYQARVRIDATVADVARVISPDGRHPGTRRRRPHDPAHRRLRSRQHRPRPGLHAVVVRGAGARRGAAGGARSGPPARPGPPRLTGRVIMPGCCAS